MKRINYYWRLFATGLAFTVFGIGGVIIPIIAVPVLYLQRGDQAQRQAKARKLIHQTFKAFVHMMRVLGILTWDIKGLEKLQRDGLLVLANHPTLLDVVFLVSFIPNANCIVKSRLSQNPAMRGFIAIAGYITNDNGEALIGGSKVSLSEGCCLVIFPEGTRTREGASLSFQRGAANIAVRTSSNITPVRIQCIPATLSKQHKWYHIPDRPFVMSFRVEDDIQITPFLDGNATLGARHLTHYLETYFTKESRSDEYRRAGT